MNSVDPRLASALAIQLAHWRATLGGGAQRVGWKLGVGEAERIGRGPVIGHLTTATQLQPDGIFDAEGVEALHADAELAIELRQEVEPGCERDRTHESIGGFGAALELVDVAEASSGAHSIVAGNVFHRAFVLGPMHGALPPGGVEGRLIVNGEVRASEAFAPDLAEVVRSVAALLGAMGERLLAGDRLITGAVVQLPVERGDEVVADFGPLGYARLTVAG